MDPMLLGWATLLIVGSGVIVISLAVFRSVRDGYLSPVLWSGGGPASRVKSSVFRAVVLGAWSLVVIGCLVVLALTLRFDG